MQITPHDGMGVVITGVDLSQPISDDLAEQLVGLYAENGLIFFRDQNITPEDHIRLAKIFGDININRFFTPVEDYPNIAEVRKNPDDKFNIGENWHTDHSYDQVPAMGSILLARQVPKTGGDTRWANMYAAYEALSDDMKDKLLQMKAHHSTAKTFANTEIIPEELKEKLYNLDIPVVEAVHPVIIKHPLSGKPALYVNPDFTVRFDGMSQEESQPLLEELWAHSVKPEFICRFKWDVGSIAFWDNRATMHSAMNDYHGQARLMHRITLDGQPLSAALH